MKTVAKHYVENNQDTVMDTSKEIYLVHGGMGTARILQK